MAEKETGIQRSTYSSYMSESDRLVALKDGYDNLLVNGNVRSEETRNQIIQFSRMLLGEVTLFTDIEREYLNSIIYKMKESHDQIIIYETNPVYGAFYDEELDNFIQQAHLFKRFWNSYKQQHNLGIQTMKEQSDIEKLYTAFEVKRWAFLNQHNIWISPQMEQYGRALYLRAKNNWNNIIFVVGNPGSGKSTFVYALYSTMAPMYELEFNLNNFFFKESRSYCERRMRQAVQYSMFDFDEANNQFNSRSFFKDDQNDLLATIAGLRFKGYTVALCWKSLKELDQSLMRAQGISVIMIDRGIATVKQFNKNPHATESLAVNKRLQKKEIYNKGEMTNLLEQEANTLMTIPFYQIPEDPWRPYFELKKKDSLLMSDISGKKRTENLYEVFLTTLPAGTVKITSQQLRSYAVKEHTALSFKKLRQLLSRATGRKADQIGILDETDNGYVIVDDYINAFIERISASRDGAKEIIKEQG